MSNQSSVASLQHRVSQASKVMKIPEESVWKVLKELGIGSDDDDALEILEASQSSFPGLSWGDQGVPQLRARRGWQILTGSASDSTNAPQTGAIKPISQYKDEELLRLYHPECSSELIEELTRRSTGRPFVAFHPDGSVDMAVSLKMLRIARRQPTTPQHVLLEKGQSRSVRLHPAGTFPTVWIEECPIHPDMVLVDGFCEKCRDTWSGIAIEERITVRLYADLISETDVSIPLTDIQRIILALRNKTPCEILEMPAIKSSIQCDYEELKEQNRLPILRRRPSTDSRKQDPFFTYNRS